MDVRFVVKCLTLCSLLLSGCLSNKAESPARIALLAPFEGRNREIGYDALYAAQVALLDSKRVDVILLPIDDGGSVGSASDRVQALALDPLIKAVIVLGYDAASIQVQGELQDLPMIVVGNWMANPDTDNVFVLSHAQLETYWTDAEPLELTEAVKIQPPFVGSEVLSLKGFKMLRSDLNGFSIVSSASLPDDHFIERILESNQFAPQPGLLSTNVYDAVGLLITGMPHNDVSRDQVLTALETITYTGISGQIAFENHYWRDAPINTYIYQGSELILSNDVIEQR